MSIICYIKDKISHVSYKIQKFLKIKEINSNKKIPTTTEMKLNLKYLMSGGGQYLYNAANPRQVFCKRDVLRNFAKCTGKHLCQSLFFKKRDSGTGVFL